jgi:hypothetical protein
MNAFIRLCLHHNIELWFIPVREPWRNDAVEKFNESLSSKIFEQSSHQMNNYYQKHLTLRANTTMNIATAN